MCVQIGDNLRRKKKKELNTLFICCKRIGDYVNIYPPLMIYEANWSKNCVLGALEKWLSN